MGETAAQLLLRRIQHPHEAYPETLTFEPELMVRESTAAAVARARSIHAKKVAIRKKPL